jgi:hypothetical protein
VFLIVLSFILRRIRKEIAMQLFKLGNRVINLESIASIVFHEREAHIYFNFDGSGSHLVLSGEEAEELKLVIEGTLVLG